MIRKHIYFFISEEKEKLIKGLPGNFSEHIRKAIDEYLDKIINVSRSSSKKGVINGKPDYFSNS